MHKTKNTDQNSNQNNNQNSNQNNNQNNNQNPNQNNYFHKMLLLAAGIVAAGYMFLCPVKSSAETTESKKTIDDVVRRFTVKQSQKQQPKKPNYIILREQRYIELCNLIYQSWDKISERINRLDRENKTDKRNDSAAVDELSQAEEYISFVSKESEPNFDDFNQRELVRRLLLLEKVYNARPKEKNYFRDNFRLGYGVKWREDQNRCMITWGNDEYKFKWSDRDGSYFMKWDTDGNPIFRFYKKQKIKQLFFLIFSQTSKIIKQFFFSKVIYFHLILPKQNSH